MTTYFTEASIFRNGDVVYGLTVRNIVMLLKKKKKTKTPRGKYNIKLIK